MSNLFLDNQFKPQFQKIAMPVKLSESPEAWQRDIAGELYKQVPYLGEYAVNVILDRVDAQRGYGFGSAMISNRTDAPMPDQTEMPTVRIPIIIRDYLMAPLDVFMDDSGVFPLTESRLREKLFRADTFELSTRKPSDKGLVDQLYPPMRSNYGMGSLGGDTMGMGKAAADAEAGRRAMVASQHAQAAGNPGMLGNFKAASLTEAIAPTISEQDASQFVDQFTNDKELAVAAVKNEAFSKLAMVIAAAPRISVEKTASVLVDSIKPNVVQLEKLASGEFRVKWANSQAFAPQEAVASPQEANQMAGADLSGMKPGSTVTLSSEKAQKQSLDEPVYTQVQQFGKYLVQDMDSNAEYEGWVVPIVDFEMQPLELYLFYKADQQPGYADSTNNPNPPQMTSPGSQAVWAVQDEIAGSTGDQSLEEWANICQGGQPQGSGVFVSAQGKCCLLPMTIQNASQGPDGTPSLVGENMFGEPVTLQMVPGLQAVQQMGEGTYGIPDSLTWISLPGDPIFLAKNPLDIENTQQAQQMPNQVSVGSTGQGEFSMDGAPLSKVAKEHRTFIKKAEAEFLLVAMGINPFEARGILSKAEEGRLVKCAGQPIVTLSHRHAQMTKKASSELANFPFHLRQNLVKEASVIDDADTADKVLAMNFINPENVSMFAKFLPELDDAAQKLAELLLGVRLGVGSVDEGAVERAMKGLEVVIEGLKMLGQKATA